MPTDFELSDQGSIVLLSPNTESARQWVEDNIGADNGYQPYYPTVIMEHRFADNVISGLQSDGLSIQ